MAEYAAGIPVGAQHLVDLQAETVCTRCLLYQLEEGIVNGSCQLTLLLGELGDLRRSRSGLRAGTGLVGLGGKWMEHLRRILSLIYPRLSQAPNTGPVDRERILITIPCMPYEIVQVINVWEWNGKCIIKFANAYCAKLFGHGADSDVGLEEAKVPQVPVSTLGHTCRRLATLLLEHSPIYGPL